MLGQKCALGSISDHFVIRPSGGLAPQTPQSLFGKMKLIDDETTGDAVSATEGAYIA